MKPIFESDRLEFSEFDISDAPNFFDLNRDKEVMKYTGDKAFENIAEAEALIRNYDSYRKSGYGRWTVRLKNTHEIIGWCGLKEHEDNTIDLGYRYHKKYWNLGYGSEAALACLKFGFKELHLPEIIGRTASENIASIKILEKIGMVFWKNAPCEGIENSVYYKIAKNDYKQI